MKKETRFILLIILLVLITNISIVSSADSNVSQEGYACLESKVENKCSSIATEEKIFSLLALRTCKEEVISDALNNECWPKSGCNIRTTAQAMLALREVNADVNKSANWILSKKIPTTQLDWLLQIESTKPTACSISYSENSYNIEINEDKLIDSSAGSCLNLYDGDYWLEVSNDCYGQNFEISCNESFITSLLYKEQGSSTVFVSEQTHSSSSGGKTTEKVESFCFKEGTSCDYEATLWASLILKKLKLDASAYIPYLVSMAGENTKYLPEAFLYLLLGESYRNEILLRQQEEKWWLVSGDKFYDTALALYPFQYEQLTEKTNSMNWLGEVQGTDGCWQGSIKDTAFLLYSIWPKKSSQPVEGQLDCEDEGYHCLSIANCKDAEGEEMEAYSGCFGAKDICCSKQLTQETCSGQEGKKCGSDETCSGGKEIPASDTDKDEICCLDGDCKAQETPSQTSCEKNSGTCKSDCSSNEEEIQYTCSGANVCCSEKTSANYTGIIIISILIVLVVLGIVFRERLKIFINKLTKKSGTGTPSQSPGPFVGPGGFPPSSSQGMPQRVLPRRIIPQGEPRRPLPPRKQEGEFSEVLRKLKEMGK